MTDEPATNVIPLRLSADDWPAPPRTAAFAGLAGEITRAIEPHSESDPLAILAQLLVSFGSAIGRGAHYAVEATEHHGNEFVLAGRTKRPGQEGLLLGSRPADLRRGRPGLGVGANRLRPQQWGGPDLVGARPRHRPARAQAGR